MKSPLALESTILFVDDETDLLEILTFQIKPFVNEIVTASSANAALKLLEKKEVDLIVTDFKIPEMTGVELITAMRGIQPQIPILMLTGFKEETAILKALNQDLFDIVEKPVRPEVLMLRIQHALLQGYLLEVLNIHFQEKMSGEEKLKYEKMDLHNQRKALYRYAGMMPRV
ncbi:MAG: response regulator [Xanthomonadaceae bacterium]|nr:response regulator [Xanthomonadaceae bacterium]